jgi:hypothetical protein
LDVEEREFRKFYVWEVDFYVIGNFTKKSCVSGGRLSIYNLYLGYTQRNWQNQRKIILKDLRITRLVFWAEKNNVLPFLNPAQYGFRKRMLTRNGLAILTADINKLI